MFKKGYKPSDTHRRKLSQSHEGKTPKNILQLIMLSKQRQALLKGKHKVKQIIKTCIICEKVFSKQPSNEKQREAKFCSNKCYGVWASKNRKGKNSFNYKNGKTSENKLIRTGIEFRLWREAVFARDNWTCQKYGIRGDKLHPHHILNFSQYPELRFAIDNGITLSEKAHREFHKKYGQQNNTREQLLEFIKNDNG